MNRLQRLIYNDGERLVPYVSHGEGELVRHRSSYAFFYSVIASDIENHRARNGSRVSIVDLGFGSGYGSALLSSLPDSTITGVDIAPECEIFARQYYSRTNVTYVIQDLTDFIPAMSPFDYAISRGVLEHVPGGLSLITKIKFKRRVMIDVPYDEPPGNEHHVLTGINEEAFSSLTNCEIFYEDIEGGIYCSTHRPENPNMIMVVISAPDLPKVSSLFEFPLSPVRDDRLEVAGRRMIAGSCNYFDTPEDLLLAAEKAVRETEVVMDIGCGIAPMNYFRPKLHFLIEPWKEYADILVYRFSGDKSVIVLRVGALEALEQFATNSVDSIFLLDVIEHLEKEEGRRVVDECERVAREQVVIFTPLGFMPQYVEANETDGWGLGGTTVQEHRSGWTPDDFSAGWTFYVCKAFHRVNFKGEVLQNSYGAFFAIRNFEGKINAMPEKMSDFRRSLPAELEVERLQADVDRLQAQWQQLHARYGRLQHECREHEKARAALRAAYDGLLNSRGVRATRFIRNLFYSIGLARRK